MFLLRLGFVGFAAATTRLFAPAAPPAFVPPRGASRPLHQLVPGSTLAPQRSADVVSPAAYARRLPRERSTGWTSLGIAGLGAGSALLALQVASAKSTRAASSGSALEPRPSRGGVVFMMFFGTAETTGGINAFPLVPLRFLTGTLMIHHGSEGGILPANYGTPGFDGFVDFIVKPYFSFLPGTDLVPGSDPALWSAIHDYVEFAGGILFAIGFFTRPVSFALFVTMIGAVYFHLASTGLQGFPLGHVENYSYNFEEPTLYAFIFLFYLFYGAGPFSVDNFIYEKIKPPDTTGDDSNVIAKESI
jgi:putative oxidoreductase